MKKLKKYIWYICVLACTIFADIAVHYIKDKKAETDYQVLEKQERDQILREKLYITGDAFEYTPDTVTIDNMQIEEDKLIIALIYFNYKNRFGISLTKNEALQEYENFCNGSGNYDKIMAFALYSWKADPYFKADLYDELEYIERNGGTSDEIETLESEQFTQLCQDILDYSHIWREANGVDYGGYDLEWKLLDVVDEELCSIDENGNYYFKFGEGRGTVYCDWGTYAPPYSEERLYITKIVYDGGIELEEQRNRRADYLGFNCFVGEKYDVEDMKGARVPAKWVIIDADTKNPQFRYKSFLVSIELENETIKRVTLSIVEE